MGNRKLWCQANSSMVFESTQTQEKLQQDLVGLLGIHKMKKFLFVGSVSQDFGLIVSPFNGNSCSKIIQMASGSGIMITLKTKK